MTTPVYEMATTYELSLIPEGSINHGPWSITVEYRGRDTWAVCHGRMTAARVGEEIAWEFESSPSNREDDYLVAHRHTLGQALELAREALPGLTVNGLTSLDVLARHVAATS